MSRKQGFTLIELMIVVAIIAIIAAIAIPSLLNARKAGNEASAISSLRTVTTVNEQYRTRFGSYADSMDRLYTQSYIDKVLGSKQKSGYDFTYASTDKNLWSCAASPTDAGKTGDRGFFVDESGVIRFNLTGTATVADDPID